MGLLNQLAIENSDKGKTQQGALQSAKDTYKNNKRLVRTEWYV